MQLRKAKGPVIPADDGAQIVDQLRDPVDDLAKPPAEQFQDLCLSAAGALLWHAGIYDVHAALDLLADEEGRAP
jgi:hypothetical protein